MRFVAELPLSRYETGAIWALVGEDMVFGPARARGEADNVGAMEHGNPDEDPTQYYGDHPFGLYAVKKLVRNPVPFNSYGPVLLGLDPISGQAFEAKLNGRTGISIHGGALHKDGRLRETYGCLRVDNDTALALAGMVESEMTNGSIVFYECREQP